MGRVRTYITVGRRKAWTLFDTGARNTYVVPKVARKLVKARLPEAATAALGGTTHTIRQTCVLVAKVEGLPIYTHARVIDEIGEDEGGVPIEILFGALAMQEWGIRPIPDEERLDLTHYSRDFVEY